MRGTEKAASAMGSAALRRMRVLQGRRAGLLATILGALATAMATGHGSVAAQETVEIPLELTAGRLTVDVSGSDGSVMRFFVSTGSATTVLSESVARLLAEEQGGTGTAREGGHAPLEGGEPGALSLAGVAIPLDDARTVRDERLSVGGVDFDGIVGVNTLNRFDVLFDIPGGRMLLREPGPSTRWPGMALGDPARVRVYHGVVIGLDVEIDGRGYAAMLDLGTPGLVVSGAVALPDDMSSSDEGLVGEDRTVTLDVGTGQPIEAPVRVDDIPMLDRWDPNGVGFALVGAVITRDCALSLSWVHREMRRCAR